MCSVQAIPPGRTVIFNKVQRCRSIVEFKFSMVGLFSYRVIQPDIMYYEMIAIYVSIDIYTIQLFISLIYIHHATHAPALRFPRQKTRRVPPGTEASVSTLILGERSGRKLA